MKKALCILLVFAMLSSLVGCSEGIRFEDESAMMQTLNGMYLREDLSDDKTYYVFQDGEIYCFEDIQVRGYIEQLFYSYVEKNKLAELCALNYEAVVKQLEAEAISCGKIEDVTVNPKKGIITLYAGEYSERQIVIKEDSVVVKRTKDEIELPLIKIAETIDFSGEKFKALFEQVKNEYTVPTSVLWQDTKAFGNIVKSWYPEVDGWNLVTKNATTTIYQSSSYVPNISGTLMITDTNVIYSYEVSLRNSVTSNIDWNPKTSVIYYPNNGSILIANEDTLSLDLVSMIQLGTNALNPYPGSFYNRHEELYDILAKEEGKVENGFLMIKKTINGITYGLKVSTDGYTAQFSIDTDEKISLSSLAKYMKVTSSVGNSGEPENLEEEEDFTEETVSSPDNSQGGDNAKKYCSQCGRSEPDTVFYEDWKTGDNCAACGYNNFNGGEDAKKYCSQCGADCTYRGLEADGRCEDCVSKDNIPTGCSHDYTEATCSKPKTCTKCGETTGSALGHDYTAATCIAPMTCETCGDTAGTVNPSAHTYQPIYSQAHYDEVGHYENVEVSYKKTVYLCFFCGYNQKGYDSLDDLREHISVHSNSYNYDAIVSRPDLLADTREVWATRYEQQWVVDEEAHDEMVVTGYTCTLCDSRKAP